MQWELLASDAILLLAGIGLCIVLQALAGYGECARDAILMGKGMSPGAILALSIIKYTCFTVAGLAVLLVSTYLSYAFFTRLVMLAHEGAWSIVWR